MGTRRGLLPSDPGSRRAVFLDRDGTLVEDRQYIGRPEDVVLLPGAAEAVKRLNDAGVLAVVVTNQSGIARGLYGEREYEAVRRRLDELLEARGARLDATYTCPHHPDFTGPCECRKPGRKLFEQAIEELGVDAARSWAVGDKWRDIAPVVELGGRGILVARFDTALEDLMRAGERAVVATTLGAAVERVLRSD
jgi:D-glycero-D-manno-heptose 1,7-bisphosphate phosphatase